MARLATVTPEGAPHVVPIVFVRVPRDGGPIWSPIDAKRKRPDRAELARVRNVRANPRVSLLLDHYDDDWQRLWWLRVDGRAEPVEGTASGGPDFEAAAAALRAKYPQYAETPLFRDAPHMLRIEVERVRSWSASA